MEKAMDVESGNDVVRLILPARFEKERELNLQTRTPLQFEDPRTKEGEELDKGRFPDRKLKKREARMTEYSRAGQLQQRPSPRGGGIFKVENFKFMKDMPDESLVKEALIYWDKAGTEGGGDFSSGIFMLQLMTGNVLVAGVERGQWDYTKREKRILTFAILCNAYYKNINVKTWHEQEPGSGGKESAERTTKNLIKNGLLSEAERVTGNKVIRSEPYQAAVDNGLVYLLIAPWNRGFIDEHEKAPNYEFKDQWDSSAGAFNKVTAPKKVFGIRVHVEGENKNTALEKPEMKQGEELVAVYEGDKVIAYEKIGGKRRSGIGY